MADIQGFYVTLTLDTNDITLYCNNLTLDRTRNVLTKPTMDGTGEPKFLGGTRVGNLSMDGQVDSDGNALLEATWAKDEAVPFTLIVGEDATITAGSYAGEILLDGNSISVAADDSWDFSMSGAARAIVFTAPTP